jgi:uncharacterized protein YehS (DUF1456 family)
MNNNDVLKMVSSALDLGNQAMVDILALDGYKAETSEIEKIVKMEKEEGFQPCSDEILSHFLDGLIIHRRGKQETGKPPAKDLPLTNNQILKKLRIALELKEEDMINTFSKVGFSLSKSELSALFRRKGHKHYRECGDQILSIFLKGLSKK